MNEIKNASKTMYIKFPTVTKLICPFESPSEHQNFRNTSYRASVNAIQNKIKMNLVSKT